MNPTIRSPWQDKINAAKQAGYSDQEIQSYISSIPAPKQTASAQPKKKKNFFLDQISTVGGIGGGILGSLLSPIAGTAGGAAVGSGLGETLENLITGDRVLDNVGKEAALGGVFGAGPIKLAKGGASLLAGRGIEAASEAALTPLRRKAGEKLVGAADDLAIKQFRLNPSQLKNFKQKFGEDAGQTIRKYGFQTADDVALKGIEPLQAQFDEVITQIPGVTKENLRKSLLSRINQLSKSGPSDNLELATSLKKEAKGILNKFDDVIDPNELNGLRREFDSLVNYTQKQANPARYGVNKRMADALRETLQKSDPTGTLKGVGRELQKLRQLSENALQQGELGRGSLPLGLGGLPGVITGSAAGGPMGAVGGYALNTAVNSPTGRRLATKGVGGIGGRLSQAGSLGQSVRGIAGRQIAQNLIIPRGEAKSLEDALINQSFENSAINPITSPNNAPTNNASILDQSSPQAGGLSRENVLSAMMVDIQTTGGKNLDKIQMLYEFANPEPTEQKPLGGEAQKRALTAQSGLRSLGTLEETLTTDPGAFQRQALPNPLGITGRLTGTTDIRAATDNVVDVIARLRSGAAITDEEAKRFARFLPLPGDSNESALRKLQAVRAELESFVNPGPALSLEDQIMQYQGAF